QVNSVTATLYVSGAIELDYGAVNGASGTIVGVAPGFGASATLTDLEGTANTMAGNGYYEQFTTLSPSDLVDGSFVRFLPVTDLVGTQAATAVDVWYPGAGGSPLAPLSATMTAAATLTQVPFTGAIDEAIQIPFGLGFEFPFYGYCYNSVYVNNHGFLEFGGTISGVSINPQDPTDANINQLIPKVMGLYSDIDGDAGGGTWYRQYNDRFVVYYVGVPSTAGAGVNDATITLYDTGAVDIELGNTDILSTNDVAIGIAAGVAGQALSGYNPPVYSNGVQRTSIDLSGLASPVVVTDKVMFERFPATGAIDLGGAISFNGSAAKTMASVGTNGVWSAPLVISSTFCGDGDVFNVSAKGFGGCNAQSRGASANRTYAIDRTEPTPSFSTSAGVENCIGGTLIVSVTADDSATAGLRMDSGICNATMEVFQGGMSLGLVQDFVIDIPTQPDAGAVVGTAMISPASFAIVAGMPFGINLWVQDCATNVRNASETFGPGMVPENITFDPSAPASQVVCSRLFAAGDTMGNNVIWELNTDTGAVLDTIDVGANWTGTDGDCALAYSSVGELFYADTDSPSATTIAVFDAVTGMISRTLVPPA
ncbi:MAG: hypothetical protein KC964_29100, partial [Candidatus Omnitrophica bacterium]|nr:hypothetical protein [Candidatus Omnitrophota bacterium]